MQHLEQTDPKVKFIMTNELLTSIAWLHSEYDREWSGRVLYTDNFSDNMSLKDLIIKPKHFILHDLGSAAYTGFDLEKSINKDFQNKIESENMDDNLINSTPLLKNLQIHSHHSMKTFFSSTDEKNLLNGASLIKPYWIEVIVNFDGEFIGKVAYVLKDFFGSDKIYVSYPIEFDYSQCNVYEQAITQKFNLLNLVQGKLNINKTIDLKEYIDSIVSDDLKTMFNNLKKEKEANVVNTNFSLVKVPITKEDKVIINNIIDIISKSCKIDGNKLKQDKYITIKEKKKIYNKIKNLFITAPPVITASETELLHNYFDNSSSLNFLANLFKFQDDKYLDFINDLSCNNNGSISKGVLYIYNNLEEILAINTKYSLYNLSEDWDSFEKRVRKLGNKLVGNLKKIDTNNEKNKLINDLKLMFDE